MTLTKDILVSSIFPKEAEPQKRQAEKVVKR